MCLCCVFVQAEYEVTPDEKRKENGQEVVDRYLNSQVAALFVSSRGRERAASPGLHPFLCPESFEYGFQSDEHMPELEVEMTAECMTRLQQEACKELFKDCTK